MSRRAVPGVGFELEVGGGESRGGGEEGRGGGDAWPAIKLVFKKGNPKVNIHLFHFSSLLPLTASPPASQPPPTPAVSLLDWHFLNFKLKRRSHIYVNDTEKVEFANVGWWGRPLPLSVFAFVFVKCLCICQTSLYLSNVFVFVKRLCICQTSLYLTKVQNLCQNIFVFSFYSTSMTLRTNLSVVLPPSSSPPPPASASPSSPGRKHSSNHFRWLRLNSTKQQQLWHLLKALTQVAISLDSWHLLLLLKGSAWSCLKMLSQDFVTQQTAKLPKS